MQVSIELPDQLARRLEPEMDHLAEIIEQGLASRRSKTSGMWKEIVSFLARGPRPEEIAAFRPSRTQIARSRELLSRNREGSINTKEKAELDELASLDNFVLLIKAEARKILATQSRS